MLQIWFFPPWVTAWRRLHGLHGSVQVPADGSVTPRGANRFLLWLPDIVQLDILSIPVSHMVNWPLLLLTKREDSLDVFPKRNCLCHTSTFDKWMLQSHREMAEDFLQKTTVSFFKRSTLLCQFPPPGALCASLYLLSVMSSAWFIVYSYIFETTAIRVSVPLNTVTGEIILSLNVTNGHRLFKWDLEVNRRISMRISWRQKPYI